jgi:hypothetical protein
VGWNRSVEVMSRELSMYRLGDVLLVFVDGLTSSLMGSGLSEGG